jgi:hypothetical protein
MSFRKPIFEILFSNRLIFDSPKKAPESTSEAPEETEEKAPSKAELDEKKDKVREETAEQTTELGDEFKEEAVVDYWIENGVGKEEEAEKDKELFKVTPEVMKDQPAEYALYKLAGDNKDFLDSEDKFSTARIKAYFDEGQGNRYGFYWDGDSWAATNDYGDDPEYSSGFLDSWPKIVKWIASAEYDETGNVSAVQEYIVTVSKYLAVAGNPVSCDGNVYAEQGIDDAKKSVQSATEDLVDEIKKKKGWALLSECPAWKNEAIVSENDQLYKYYYDEEEKVVVAAGIAGTSRSERMYVLGEGENWESSNWNKVEDDTKKKEYFTRAYDAMDSDAKKDAYSEIAPTLITEENLDDPESEPVLLEASESISSFKFEFVPLNKEDTRAKVVKSLKKGLKDKLGDKKEWSDAEIEKAAELRADKVMEEAETNLKDELGDAYYDYAFVSKNKFEFTFLKGAKLKLEKAKGLKAKYDKFKKAADKLDKVKEKAKEVKEETVEGIIAAAIKASKNPNIDPAKAKAYVDEMGDLYGGDTKKAAEGYIKIMSMPFGLGVLVLQFMKPILKSLKGSIGKMVDSAKKQGDKMGEKVADKIPGGKDAKEEKEKEKKKPKLAKSDISKLDKGDTLEKDGAREFEEFEDGFALSEGVYEISEIYLDEKTTVTDEGHWLRKGKSTNLKLVVGSGGLKLPKVKKIRNVKVLAKSASEGKEHFRVADGKSKTKDKPKDKPTELADAETDDKPAEAPAEAEKDDKSLA